MLIAGLNRADAAGETVNDNPLSGLKDMERPVEAFGMMRQGLGSERRFFNVKPELFNQFEPDVQKRDAQIEALKHWYQEHKDHLQWDSSSRKLVIKE